MVRKFDYSHNTFTKRKLNLFHDGPVTYQFSQSRYQLINRAPKFRHAITRRVQELSSNQVGKFTIVSNRRSRPTGSKKVKQYPMDDSRSYGSKRSTRAHKTHRSTLRREYMLMCW